MDLSLRAIHEILQQDLPGEELALRLFQYVECATGAYCPEVAFDPVAIRLRSIAARLGSDAAGAQLLHQWVEQIRALSRWQTRLARQHEPAEAADEVTIIATGQAGNLAGRGLRVPASFELRFPRWWRAEPMQNRHAAAIEQQTLSWLRGYGIGCEEQEAEKLRKFNCAMYGGYSLPQADFQRALLVTQFISLWLFWDDMQVEEEQGWDIEAVIRALTCDDAMPVDSRYIAAWADIGRRLRTSQSESWLRHLAVTMRQWLENAKIETGVARCFRRGQCPDFEWAFHCRTISIGMDPTFHLIEYAEGLELPNSFHRHPLVVRLKRLASRLVGMGNDLGGLAKDIKDNWLNLVLVLKERSALSIQDAFARLVAIHNADVVEFDDLTQQLPRWGAEADRAIQRWLEALRYNVHGFTLWEATAERYQEHKALIGNIALVAPVVIADPEYRPAALAA